MLTVSEHYPVALPFSKIILNTPKSPPPSLLYLNELKSLGDHIRQHRPDLVFFYRKMLHLQLVHVRTQLQVGRMEEVILLINLLGVSLNFWGIIRFHEITVLWKKRKLLSPLKLHANDINILPCILNNMV